MRIQHYASNVRRWIVLGVAVAAMVGVPTGCSSWRLTDVEDPSSIVDLSAVQTETGAIAMYKGAISNFDGIFAGGSSFDRSESFVTASGAGGDEFYTNDPGFALRRVGYTGVGPGVGSGGVELPWYQMHKTRLQMDQAIGMLNAYGTTTPSSYSAQLYALRGYLSVMFAELFCSGLPFSRAVFGGDIVMGRPLSTEQVFEQAIADFDSALALDTDSLRIRQLATMGKARALVNLDRIADAATLVSGIPTTYRYDVRFLSGWPNYLSDPTLRMMDRLAGVGLDYRSAGSAGDFRVASVTSPDFFPIPAKFNGVAASIPLTDGLEARLIEAEAKLRAEDFEAWADILNTLRQTGDDSRALPALPADSTINANQRLRETVMFRERAFWLYGTGRRFGDMRRLVRQYHWTMSQVFPQGLHPNVSLEPRAFSDYPNFAPPTDELRNNPHFTGCFNRDA